jgi:tetratricopeptide (TPR) repeat protein
MVRASFRIGICFAVLAAHAEPVYPTKAETRQLLQTGHFDVLDQRYGEIQAEYDNGVISDVDLRAAFRTFYDPDPALERWFEAWTKHLPNSYVAHLARGIYYKYVGGERRGSEFSDNTTSAQFAGMHAAHRVAVGEFDLSLTLETKPLLTYLHSIDIEMREGTLANARALLDKAITIDPHNFVVREKFMGALQTRWLGNQDEMRKFLTESLGAGLTDDQLKTLESLVLEDEAWVRQVVQHDQQGAVDTYREASALNAPRDCRPCGPAMQGARLSQDRGDFKGAIELYSKALAENPSLVEALNGRGYAQLQLGNGSLAAEDFLKSAQLGDVYGQMELAKLMLEGRLIPEDNERGLAWLERAAENKYPPAQDFLIIVRGDIARRSAQGAKH